MQLSLKIYCKMTGLIEQIDVNGDEVRLWRHNEFNEPTYDLPAHLTISPACLEKIRALLTMLQVQQWRSTYETTDIAPDYLVIDGGDWELNYQDGSTRAQITGDNAYPALEDPAKASAEEERLGILRRTLLECLVADYN